MASSVLADTELLVIPHQVALSGDLAPGTNPAISFMHLCRPILSESGHVAFEAILDRSMVGQEDDGGIWVWDGSLLSLVARQGEPSSDFAELNGPQFAVDAALVFTAVDEDDQEVIWERRNGVLSHIAGVGDLVPPDSAELGAFRTRPVPGPGFVSFAAWVDSFPYPDSFWMWTTRSGLLDTTLPPGTDLPGTDSSSGPVFDLVVNSAGEHAFHFHNDWPYGESGIWREKDGDLVKIVQGLDFEPDDPDRFYEGFKWLSCGDARTGFFAFVGGDWPHHRAVYLADDEDLVQFVTHYDDAPNLAGAQIRFFSHPQVLDNDQVVLTAALTGDGIDESNNTAIWRGEPDDLQFVAREGDHIPGLGGDVVIRDFQAVAVNEDYAALYVSLFGYTVGDNDRALILIDPDGDTHLITRVGDKFDVAGDGSDMRSVKHIGMLPADPERGRSPLNSGGTIAFLLEFYDGTSGVFTARLTPPCPGDIDGDHDTDQSDLGLLLASYELDPGDPFFNSNADLNGDGAVGQPDLGILLADYECDPHE
ncbi:MAG: choice-of-anchor tandem repeat NxxGxxAF-containing protein [Phycisphaerales bacterium JB038]